MSVDPVNAPPPGDPIQKSIESTSKSVSLSAPAPTGKRLIWTDITVSVPFKGKDSNGVAAGGRKTVLEQVSGIAHPGEVLAIMGGSGAGKTTLLNGFVNVDQDNIERTGELTVNGEVLDNTQMRRISAYVQQVDMFLGTLKVKEQLKFSAQLRMGRSYTAAQRRERVEQVIRDLGLTNAANTMIGVPGREKGISIGEKKRLAFACEILTDPMILFCDEPTSGLDSFMAQQVVAALTDLARQGKTIITTIHQPSTQVFLMFDKVCFMSMGKVAYFGPAKLVADFWKSVGPEFECPVTFNPADHAIATLSKNDDEPEKCLARIKKIREKFEESYWGQRLFRKTHHLQSSGKQLWNNADLKKGYTYPSNWFTQFRVLFIRALLTTIRNPLLLKVRVFQVLVTAIVIAAVNFRTPLTGPTLQNLEGMLYNCARDMNFMFLFPSINVITSELPLFVREHRAHIYRVETYYFAKTFAELPQYTLLPFLYSSIVYFITGLVALPGRFFVFCLTNILQCWVAISIAYAGACVFGVDDLSLTYMPILVLPMLVFGGFYINYKNIPVYLNWASYLSWFRHGFDALQINQWSAIDEIPGCNAQTETELAAPDSLDYCPAHSGLGVLERRGMGTSSWRMWLDIGILFLMFVVFRLFALGALFIRVRFTK
uniref:ABC transporter domain-containing protein n=1 Tax=Panagrellus redivivus TaxID=6233 RepID=A0A7E4ZYS7_PANRE